MSEKNINFDIPLKDFLAEEIIGANIKELILNTIGTSKAKDGPKAIKAFNLGIKIANNEELKSEDIVILRTIITDTDYLAVLAKGQILKMLEDQ